MTEPSFGTEPARLPRARTGRAAERAAFVAWRAGEYDSAGLAEAMAQRLAGEPGIARVFAASNTRRWVPIGPSVILSADGRTFLRATGRVRDLRISDDGRRAYAASARGGLWYSEDAGALWSPVGGWATRSSSAGGTSSAQSCGCLDVAFGATTADDYVMVGTGELQGFGRPPFRPAQAGIGVLAAKGPAVAAGGGGDPWEPASGLAQLDGLGCFALARDPAATAGRPSGAGRDRVLVGTTAGLFLGTRRPAGPLPHTGEFVWSLLPQLGPFLGLAAGRQPIVTDVRWLPGPGDGRIIVAVALGLETPTAPGVVGSGVAVSDNHLAATPTYRWVTGLDPTAVGAEPGIGRMSFAMPATTSSRLYVLGERRTSLVPPDVASVWRIDRTVASPSATLLTGVPDVWTRSSGTGKNQRDYDQTIAVDEAVPGIDRVYLGGNFESAQGRASVWCLDVPVAGTALVATPTVSRAGTVAAGGDDADPAGLIGDNIHPDVHMIRFAGPAVSRHVWIATDGGIYVSTQAGRVNSFAPRSTGLAAVEVNYISPHPVSSHYMAAGTQDNGRHVRLADVVWQDTMDGDGGGVAFHPTAPQWIVSQFHSAAWAADPPTGFVHPLSQGSGASITRENDLAAFYSGAAAIARTATASRMAIGTNRVWLTDDLAVSNPCTWRALPFPSGAATNPRPLGADATANRGVGVPGGAPLAAVVGGAGPLGAVITAKWATPRVLLVVFVNGVVRWTQDAASGLWAARVLVGPAGAVLSPAVTGAPDPARTLLSDVAPVPGTNDFYLVTTGVTAPPVIDTCLYFDDATSTFFPTNLRGQLAPLDPAYASVVDPAATSEVFVGTVTGVWHGARPAGPSGAAWPHTWTPRVNGLPSTLVQDLSIWQDPSGAAGSPRLLRAAMQSRGIWELNLAAASEPQRTYTRVHDFDDRRILPTPMKNPRLKLTRPDLPAFASPDITVRPQAMAGISPAWPLAAAAVIPSGSVPRYQLWTFQTAFRWLFPSVTANGEWSEPLGTLVALHRSSAAAMAPALPKINKATWDDVVGNVHVTAAGVVTRVAGDPLAVYRAPWQTSAAPNAVATELDVTQHVVYRQVLAGVAQVFAEPSTVDVLIHHRDTRPVLAGRSFTFLFWQTNAAQAALLALNADPIRTYVAAVLAGGPALPGPAGWNVVLNGAGDPRHTLAPALDARMPRAVPVDLNLGPPNVTPGHSVLLVAVAGSDIDPCAAPPVGLPATPTAVDLARSWPYAAVRLVRVSSRP